MFSFSSEILCSVSGFQMKAYKNEFHLSLNYWKSNCIYLFWLTNGVTIKLKAWKSCVIHYLKTFKNNNFNSRLVVAVCTFSGTIWIYFCCGILTGCQFCDWVYKIWLDLLKSNGKMLMKWLSEQFWRCCSCMSSFGETAEAEVTASVTCFSLCVVNTSARYREQTAPYAFESLSRMSNTDRSVPHQLLVEHT